MKRWQKKETKDAELFQGKRTPRSGGFWAFPGDVKSGEFGDGFLVDSKETTNKSYSITTKTWDKVNGEALKSGRIPILSIRIINYRSPLDLVILDRNDFVELMKRGDINE